jgi:hypothetical protein
MASNMKKFGCCLFLGALMLAPGPVWAQTSSDVTPSSAPAGQSGPTAVRTEGGRRVYVASTTIEVRGEIQRPYAFSVSGRSSLGYTYFDQPIQFLQLILDAVRRAPF